MQNPIDNDLPVTAVERHPLDHSTVYVDPIEALVNAIEVQSDHAGQALQNERVGLPICRQIPQIIAVAEDEVRRDVAVLTAAASVWLSEESWRALAHVGANGVFADLTAHARCLCAFIDIVARFAVGHQTVAGTAGAYEAGGRVSAVVITVVNGQVSAFIDTCIRSEKTM